MRLPTHYFRDRREGEHEHCEHEGRNKRVHVDRDRVQAAGLQQEDGHELEGHAGGEPCDDVRGRQQPGYTVGCDASL